MNRLLLRVIATVSLVVALAACSPDVGRDMTVRLDPVGTLDYEVDNSGAITVTTRAVVFRNGPGQPAATIRGVHVGFYDGDVFHGDWIVDNGLSLVVPAGFSCPEPDAVLGCTATSPGAFPAPGQESVIDQATLQVLTASVVEAHRLAGSPPGWYAEFTFVGERGYEDFELVRHYYIVAPN